jgi:copper chaperone CopZ
MQTTLKVEGMMCSHCEEAVKKTVSSIPGVTGVVVDLAMKTVTVSHDDVVTADVVKRSVEGQGYDVI